jgi:hypothetical protein
MSEAPRDHSEIVADLNKLAGELDHGENSPRTHNPHRPGTREYDEWQAGWDAAAAADKLRDSS